MNKDIEKQIFEEFQRSWIDYPSQDNEGYVPDRGGYKAGFFNAAHFGMKLERERIKNIGDIMAEAIAYVLQYDLNSPERDRLRKALNAWEDFHREWLESKLKEDDRNDPKIEGQI